MGSPLKASATSKDQTFPTSPPIPGDWKFDLKGPDARQKLVSDLSQPVSFFDVQPGKYTCVLQRMAQNGVDPIGDPATSNEIDLKPADVIIAVAAGITLEVIQQSR